MHNLQKLLFNVLSLIFFIFKRQTTLINLICKLMQKLNMLQKIIYKYLIHILRFHRVCLYIMLILPFSFLHQTFIWLMIYLFQVMLICSQSVICIIITQCLGTYKSVSDNSEWGLLFKTRYLPDRVLINWFMAIYSALIMYLSRITRYRTLFKR